MELFFPHEISHKNRIANMVNLRVCVRRLMCIDFRHSFLFFFECEPRVIFDTSCSASRSHSMDTVSLRQRKFWKKKEISWPDVNSISRFGTTDSVQIMYRHQAEDYSFIVASPKENSKFIAALRLFAPQAHFDL
jgi:hypothetical protein